MGGEWSSGFPNGLATESVCPHMSLQWRISRGGGEGRAPPGPNSFNFMQFIGKIWQNRMLALPPRGNPGSATALLRRCFSSK